MGKFKFRAFNKKHKEMVYDTEHFSVNDLNNENEHWTQAMQYTGLKDKQLKEIYEGDIVRAWEESVMIPNRDSGGGIIDFDEDEGFSQIGIVTFYSPFFAYQTKKHLRGRKEEIFAPLDFVDGIEVIGNIYEHYHLLEGES
jgi:uncharacterized phage protein (TIGR01671 family)